MKLIMLSLLLAIDFVLDLVLVGGLAGVVYLAARLLA